MIRKASIVLALLALLCSCGTKSDIIYSRSTKAPEETRGMLRIAQNSVRANVTGTDHASEFELDPAGGYYIVHETDLAQLVRNTEALQAALLRVRELEAKLPNE